MSFPIHEKKSALLGTQSASKVLRLLKIVGAHHAQGIRLKELIEASQIDKSTAHRLLVCMLEEGFVERVGASKVYRLGIEPLQWGFSSAGMEAFSERFRPTLMRLARITNDAVFLMVRSGDYVVCLSRVEGDQTTKAYVVEVGVRRLLGASAAGLAIMSKLSDEEVHLIMHRHEDEYVRQGFKLTELKAAIQRARLLGYSKSHNRRIDSGGVGCAFSLAENYWAGISIAAAKHRSTPERLEKLAQLVLEEVAKAHAGH